MTVGICAVVVCVFFTVVAIGIISAGAALYFEEFMSQFGKKGTMTKSIGPRGVK